MSAKVRATVAGEVKDAAGEARQLEPGGGTVGQRLRPFMAGRPPGRSPPGAVHPGTPHPGGAADVHPPPTMRRAPFSGARGW